MKKLVLFILLTMAGFMYPQALKDFDSAPVGSDLIIPVQIDSSGSMVYRKLPYTDLLQAINDSSKSWFLLTDGLSKSYSGNYITLGIDSISHSLISGAITYPQLNLAGSLVWGDMSASLQALWKTSGYFQNFPDDSTLYQTPDSTLAIKSDYPVIGIFDSLQVNSPVSTESPIRFQVRAYTANHAYDDEIWRFTKVNGSQLITNNMWLDPTNSYWYRDVKTGASNFIEFGTEGLFLGSRGAGNSDAFWDYMNSAVHPQMMIYPYGLNYTINEDYYGFLVDSLGTIIQARPDGGIFSLNQIAAGKMNSGTGVYPIPKGGSVPYYWGLISGVTDTSRYDYYSSDFSQGKRLAFYLSSANFNTVRTTFSEAIDTSAFYIQYSTDGMPQVNLIDGTGSNIFNISNHGIGLGGTAPANDSVRATFWDGYLRLNNGGIITGSSTLILDASNNFYTGNVVPLTTGRTLGASGNEYATAYLTNMNLHSALYNNGVQILDNSQNLINISTIAGTSTLRGKAQFTGTDLSDTVAVSGASASDLYTVTPTSSAAAPDDLTVEPTSTGFIVWRSAGTTSGLNYFWIRIK